jgi:uncharacterized protein YcfL
MKNVFALSLIALALVACGKKEEVKVEPVVEAAPAVAPAEVGKPADDKVEAPAVGGAVAKEDGKSAVK